MTEIAADQQVSTDPLADKKGAKDTLKNYKNKFRRAIEEVYVDSMETHSVSNNFSTIFDSERSKYDKTVALLQVASKITPKYLRKRIHDKYKYTESLFPVDPENYRLKEKLNKGHVNDIFLLESRKSDSASYVIKVNRNSQKDRSPSRLIKIASEQKSEFEEISSIFNNDELIPPEHYVVIHGPRNNEPVAIMIQPFVGNAIKDVFEDFDKNELTEIASRNANVKSQLTSFVEVINSNPKLIENELDLLGKDNLAIVGRKGEEKLLFLDPHYRGKKYRGPEFRKQIKDRVGYLAEIVSSQ